MLQRSSNLENKDSKNTSSNARITEQLYVASNDLLPFLPRDLHPMIVSYANLPHEEFYKCMDSVKMDELNTVTAMLEMDLSLALIKGPVLQADGSTRMMTLLQQA